VRLLLDSHTIYWWIEDPGRIAVYCRNLICDPANEIFFSPVSIWELFIKVSKGKLKVPFDLADRLTDYGIIELPVTAVHASRTLSLPRIHDDPFDRMLIAQTLVEGLVLATRDTTIKRYDVPTIEA